jgi:ribosomal protein S18 acetylase RimI-like enzyme
MEIRRARPADAAAIAEVHVRTWQAAYAHVFGAERLAAIDAGGRRAQWERSITRGGVWVAEDEGRVVGFVSVGASRHAEGEGELYAIYVLPEAWGLGAAPALLRPAVEALRAAYPTSILWVLDDNPRARRFYEREGWRPDGGTQTEEFLGVPVTEVRYRLD